MDTVDSVLNIDAHGHSRNNEDWKVVEWGDADYRSPDCQTGVFQALTCVDEVRKRTSEGRKKVFETSQDQYVSLQGILAWDWTSQKQSYVKIRSVRELEASCWDHMRGSTHVEGHCRTKEPVDLIVANVRKIPQKSWRVR